MKFGSALAAFALFGKSNAISISSNALVESQAQASSMVYPGDLCCNLYRDKDWEGEPLKICYDLP